MRSFVILAAVAALAVVAVSVQAEPMGRLQARVLAEVSTSASVGAEQLALAEAYLDVSAEAEAKIQALTEVAAPTTFAEFVAQHKKTYPTAAAKAAAEHNFNNNLKSIEALNKEHAPVVHSVGPFADLTYGEFLTKHTGAKPVSGAPSSHSLMEVESEAEEEVESESEVDSVDQSADDDFEVRFTEEGVEVQGLAARNWLTHATPIKNQGQCGSCAHHSAVEAYETAASIAGKGLKAYSPQQLMDCNHISSNHGCSGSDTGGHWTYLQTHGASLASAYPYVARVGTCRQASGPGAKLKSWNYVCSAENGPTTSESAIYTALEHGPVVIYVNASPSWMHYKSGIMSPGSCSSSLSETNHAVTLMGYGSSSGHPYWLVRNHWSTSWGEKGYIRLAYGHNTCGVANWAMQAHF